MEQRYDTEKFTPPFRVGRKQQRAVLDSNGHQVIVFPYPGIQAQLYCDYLNHKLFTLEETKAFIDSAFDKGWKSAPRK